ncbi:hypothetical protein [Aegicerativicinus sediminis]|uniref:hypothetical protein n=1 Tax=Aegicerativicinus sediminis TaxID=2893202 RepID=UPI001E619715|nr:hypothetical protein [Aegicerativicinus sediminis]
MKELDFNSGKGSGFKIPKDYLQDFDSSMYAKISEENLKSNIEASGFTVPKDYFSSFEKNLQSAMADKVEPRVIPIFERPIIKVAMAIAAILVVYFSFFNSPTTSTNFQKLETSSIDNYLSDISFTSEELATLMENEDLNLSYLEETQIHEDALQSYFEDQLIIDDLINE